MIEKLMVASSIFQWKVGLILCLHKNSPIFFPKTKSKRVLNRFGKGHGHGYGKEKKWKILVLLWGTPRKQMHILFAQNVTDTGMHRRHAIRQKAAQSDGLTGYELSMDID